MSANPENLIDGYLDETLSEDELAQLSAWIKADVQNVQTFARAIWLHDRLHNALTLDEIEHGLVKTDVQERTTVWSMLRSSMTSHWGAISLATAAVCMAMLWFSFGPSSASAAFRELDRIILSTKRSADRTYTIVVEDVVANMRRDKSSNQAERPPKPPLDGATLYLRDGQRFVLIRQTNEGLPFITGCNGSQSWAVNPRGVVRVSPDIDHFNHDLPGHETSIPLTNIQEGLERLKQSYELQFSTAGPEEYEPQGQANVRLLMAVKKPRVRGPQRVEIAYESSTGRILHMRFVGMPYGPDRLDLRLSLVNENELAREFFEHTSHHSPERTIEMEN